MEKIEVKITFINGAKLLHEANFGTYIIYKCQDEKGFFFVRIEKEPNCTTVITKRINP